MTALLSDPIVLEHNPGPGHPEQAARYEAVLDGLKDWPLTPLLPREATLDELALCHHPRYVELARREVEAGYPELSTGDVQVNRHSYEVARRAAGVVLTAVDLVLNKQAANAFWAVRPPGHHATADRGMGFCLFNNIALGARYARKRHGIGRVLILDWDVHHGNGTQDIFYQDGDVFFCSTHQSPWYPGTGAANETGEAAGSGATLNFPFAAGAGRKEILGAVEQQLTRAMQNFRPELVMISAGFDSRHGDPLGQFRLTDEDFADLTRRALGIADAYAGGRVISVLEGGYNLDGLTKAVHSHVNALHEG